VGFFHVHEENIFIDKTPLQPRILGFSSRDSFCLIYVRALKGSGIVLRDCIPKKGIPFFGLCMLKGKERWWIVIFVGVNIL
jgi:hypothetical protein